MKPHGPPLAADRDLIVQGPPLAAVPILEVFAMVRKYMAVEVGNPHAADLPRLRRFNCRGPSASSVSGASWKPTRIPIPIHRLVGFIACRDARIGRYRDRTRRMRFASIRSEQNFAGSSLGLELGAQAVSKQLVNQGLTLGPGCEHVRADAEAGRRQGAPTHRSLEQVGPVPMVLWCPMERTIGSIFAGFSASKSRGQTPLIRCRNCSSHQPWWGNPQEAHRAGCWLDTPPAG